MTGSAGRECGRARLAIHEGLDGQPLVPDLERELRSHLDSCPSCAALDSELRAQQEALRGLPARRLSDAALERVWDRTVRAGGAARPRHFRWEAAAAAAVLVAALVGLWGWHRATRGPVSEPDLSRAAEDTRLVLAMTARVLERTRGAAVDRVLGGEVSRALRRVPVRWPEPAPEPRDEPPGTRGGPAPEPSRVEERKLET